MILLAAKYLGKAIVPSCLEQIPGEVGGGARPLSQITV